MPGFADIARRLPCTDPEQPELSQGLRIHKIQASSCVQMVRFVRSGRRSSGRCSKPRLERSDSSAESLGSLQRRRLLGSHVRRFIWRGKLPHPGSRRIATGFEGDPYPHRGKGGARNGAHPPSAFPVDRLGQPDRRLRDARKFQPRRPMEGRPMERRLIKTPPRDRLLLPFQRRFRELQESAMPWARSSR